MKNRFEFVATVRNDMGKGASRRLRKQGLIPAIVYGAGKAAETVNLDHNKIINASANESFYASILTLKIGKDREQEVILKDLQRHPYKPIIMHMDLQRVQADVELKVHVPIHFLNEEKAVGVKNGGLLSHLINDVEITCLPRHLPQYIELDVLNLAIDQTLHLSDLKLPQGVTLVALHGEDANDLPVVSIHMPKAVTEEETAAPVAPETEVINEKKVEGDDAAEGKAKK